MTYPFLYAINDESWEIQVENHTNRLLRGVSEAEIAHRIHCPSCRVQEIPQVPTGGSYLTRFEVTPSDIQESSLFQIGYRLAPGEVFVPVYVQPLEPARHIKVEFGDGILLELSNKRKLALKLSQRSGATIHPQAMISGFLEFYKRS